MSTVYRSGFENRIANWLKGNKVRFTYEHLSFEYYQTMRGAYCEDCHSENIAVSRSYTPDFFFTNGVILEAKGKFTSRDRSKILAFKKTWPDEDLRLVFMRDNKLNRRSKNRYSDWAMKHGIPYHVGYDVPIEWSK